MELSVIILPGTGTSSLDKVLTGYALQTWRPLEVSAWKGDLADGAGDPGQRLQSRRVRGRYLRGGGPCLQLSPGLAGPGPDAEIPRPGPACGPGLASTWYG